MKANELRIGNWVDIEALDVQVECLPIDYNYSHLHPIPLTEEWLVKLGGNYVVEGYVEWQIPKYSEGKESICIEFDSNGCYFTGGEGCYFSKNIQYVHQLQNLYFALTGEELTIK